MDLSIYITPHPALQNKYVNMQLATLEEGMQYCMAWDLGYSQLFDSHFPL